MRRSPEPLRLSAPLRQVRLVGPVGSVCQEGTERARAAMEPEPNRREAEEALKAQLEKERAAVLELQEGVLRSLRDVIPQLVREAESSLIALAMEAAQRLVAGLPISPEMVEAVVREALAGVEQGSDLLVLLHPEDLDLLKQVNSPVLVTELGGERIRFQTGRDVTRGGCIVQTRFGSVDARRETKLALLTKSLEP